MKVYPHTFKDNSCFVYSNVQLFDLFRSIRQFRCFPILSPAVNKF